MALAFALWIDHYYRNKCKRCDLEALKRRTEKKLNDLKPSEITKCTHGCDMMYMDRYGRCVRCGYNWFKQTGDM